MNYFRERHINRFPEQFVSKSDNTFWSDASGAFFGALFAFFFGLAAFYIQKKFERYWKHKNAVVELEHLLNDHLSDNSSNQYLLEGAIKVLKINHMTYTLLNQFRLPEDLSLRLGNIDLMNKCAEYKEAVLKLNRGMSAWQGLNQQLQQSVISNFNLPPAIIHANRKHIQDQAEALNKFLIGLSEDMKVLLAYTRIYLRKDKHILSVWLLKYNNKDQPIISEEEINAEMKILESEIEEISKKSRDRISKILEK